MLTQWRIRVRVILAFAIVAVLGQTAPMAQAVNGSDRAFGAERFWGRVKGR